MRKKYLEHQTLGSWVVWPIDLVTQGIGRLLDFKIRNAISKQISPNCAGPFLSFVSIGGLQQSNWKCTRCLVNSTRAMGYCLCSLKNNGVKVFMNSHSYFQQEWLNNSNGGHCLFVLRVKLACPCSLLVWWTCPFFQRSPKSWIPSAPWFRNPDKMVAIISVSICWFVQLLFTL